MLLAAYDRQTRGFDARTPPRAVAGLSHRHGVLDLSTLPMGKDVAHRAPRWPRRRDSPRPVQSVCVFDGAFLLGRHFQLGVNDRYWQRSQRRREKMRTRAASFGPKLYMCLSLPFVHRSSGTLQSLYPVAVLLVLCCGMLLARFRGSSLMLTSVTR